MHQSRSSRTFAALLAVAFMLVLGRASLVGQSEARVSTPSVNAVRDRLEGTWRLIEEHVDGRVLTAPEIDGRWSNHDGVALALLYRLNGTVLQSTANYGFYEMDQKHWSFRYTRTQTTQGPTEGPAMVRVSETQLSRFEIVQEGDKLVLIGPQGRDNRREYYGPYMDTYQKGRVWRRWQRLP